MISAALLGDPLELKEDSMISAALLGDPRELKEDSGIGRGFAIKSKETQ
jgi:hypothetical protein